MKSRNELHTDLEKTTKELEKTVTGRGFSLSWFWDLIGLGDISLFKGDYKKKHGLPDNENVNDYLHPLLITGKNVALDTTNQQAQNGISKEEILNNHLKNNYEIRELLKQNTGYKPENIPPQKKIKKK
jgi:hypothetical protein